MVWRSIREVQIGDLDTLVDLETQAYDGFGASRERIARRLGFFPQGFLVAQWRGKVVGFINSGAFQKTDLADETLKELEGHDPQGPTLVVFSLVVAENQRGRGWARRLMITYILRARELGKERILLICEENLIDLYRKFGFRYKGLSACAIGGHQWHEMELMLKCACGRH